MKKTRIILAVLTTIFILSAASVLLAESEKKTEEAGICGNWKIATEQGGRQMSNKLQIAKKADGSLKIVWNEGIQEDEIQNVNFKDNKLTFTRTVFMGDFEFDIDVEATLKDDKLTGELITDRGETPFTGTRIKQKPECVGVWLIQTGPADRQRTSELIITQNDKGELEGKWVSERGESKISNLKCDKGKLTFERVISFGDREMKSTFAGQVKGNELTGTFTGERGEREMTGKRKGEEYIGRWDLVSITDRGDFDSALWIDNDLTATYSMGFGNVDANDLKLEDGKVKFNISFGFGDRGFQIDFDLKIDGDKIKGQSSSEMGTSEVSGKKFVPKPAMEKPKAEEKAKED
jgi:hypothetical protein